MATENQETQIRQRMHRIETLLQEVERSKDSEARARTKEIVQALMDVHGAGLERLLDRLASSGEAGRALIDSLAQDELIASLLLLYGLHPLDLDARVGQALEKVRPYLHSHGGNVELLGVDDGVVRLRLQGSCHGCPSSAQTLKQTIEEAIYEKAPDTVAIEVEAETGEVPEAPGDAAAAGHNGDSGRGGRFALPILAR